MGPLGLELEGLDDLDDLDGLDDLDDALAYSEWWSGRASSGCGCGVIDGHFRPDGWCIVCVQGSPSLHRSCPTPWLPDSVPSLWYQAGEGLDSFVCLFW